MSIFALIILCLIQGLTEFLPVSSSGHLIIAEKLFGITENNLIINLFLHLASLLAVITYYHKAIFNLLKKPFQPTTYKLIISTIISVIIALSLRLSGLYDTLSLYFGYYFIATSIILLLLFFYQKKSCVIKLNEISYKDSLIVGLTQGIAVLPGISRSGSTIASLMFCGNSQKSSSSFSFLMSIPIIIGGFAFEIINYLSKAENISKNAILSLNFNLLYIIFAFFLTYITSLFSIKLLNNFLKNNKIFYFSIYLFALGIISILIF